MLEVAADRQARGARLGRGGQPVGHAPRPPRPLGLGQRRGRPRLADAERLQRQLVVLRHAGQPLVLDVHQKLLEAVAARPCACPTEP
ncbi:MAG: hypothetical protein ACK559_19770, partial [bacterium]